MKKPFVFVFLLLFGLLSTVYAQNRTAVAVLFDVSKSVPATDFAAAKSAAQRLAQTIGPADQVFVYSFGSQLQEIGPNDIAGLRLTDTYTILYDAAYDAAQALAKSNADRKAMIVVSDGYDTRSATELEDIVAYANERGIVIHGIGAGKANRKTLERMAKLTGGKFFGALDPQLAQQIVSAIENQPVVAKSGQPAAVSVPPSAAVVTPQQMPAVSAPVPPAPAAAPSGNTPWWLLFLGAAILLLGVVGFVVVRLVREPQRVCPSCGRTLQPYQTFCPECSTAPNKKQPGDGTQEIQTPAADDELEPVPMELLEKKPVTEEMLNKTFVLMETPVLVVRKGRNLGQSFALNRSFPISIGRSRVNEIHLDDVAVSGQHCRIISENGKHVLYDLGSTNGTFINDKKVSRAFLKEGDTIKIGETQFMYKIEQHRA